VTTKKLMGVDLVLRTHLSPKDKIGLPFAVTQLVSY